MAEYRRGSVVKEGIVHFHATNLFIVSIHLELPPFLCQQRAVQVRGRGHNEQM